MHNCCEFCFILRSPQFCLEHKHQQIHGRHHQDGSLFPSFLSQYQWIAQGPTGRNTSYKQFQNLILCKQGHSRISHKRGMGGGGVFLNTVKLDAPTTSGFVCMTINTRVQYCKSMRLNKGNKTKLTEQN